MTDQRRRLMRLLLYLQLITTTNLIHNHITSGRSNPRLHSVGQHSTLSTASRRFLSTACLLHGHRVTPAPFLDCLLTTQLPTSSSVTYGICQSLLMWKWSTASSITMPPRANHPPIKPISSDTPVHEEHRDKHLRPMATSH